MYKPGTVLELKEQRKPSERKNREGETITDEKDKPIKFEFPYNRVEVIGESPISYAGEGWEGTGARGVIIKPLAEFAGNLDEPYGKLQQLYKVVSIPEPSYILENPVRVITPGDLGPTPEEIFAQEAPGVKPEAGQKRGRTSPLGDLPAAADPSPLGAVEQPAEEKPVRKTRTSPLD